MSISQNTRAAAEQPSAAALFFRPRARLIAWASLLVALLVAEGGPANATTTAPLNLYVRAFEYGELGYASTLSVILLVLTALAAVLPLWLAARLALRQRSRT